MRVPNRSWSRRRGSLALVLALLGCGGGAVSGLHGPVDGSADRPAAAGGHGAAGSGGTAGIAGTGGNRPDGAAVDAATGGSTGASGAGGLGGTTGRTDAAVDLGPATGGHGGAGAGAGASGGAGAGGGAGAAPACDPVAQTGCPAGDKCAIGPVCTPNGAVGDGKICATTGFDDCASPDLCIGDGTAHLCRQACNVGADCHQAAVASGATAEPNNLARCLISLTGSTTKVCTLACNPVLAAGPSGCQSGYTCFYYETTPVPEGTDCEPAGTVAEGGDCSLVGCAAGLVCVNTGATERCRQVCRTGNNADCSVAGDTCVMPTGVTSPMFGFCCAAAGC